MSFSFKKKDLRQGIIVKFMTSHKFKQVFKYVDDNEAQGINKNEKVFSLISHKYV